MLPSIILWNSPINELEVLLNKSTTKPKDKAPQIREILDTPNKAFWFLKISPIINKQMGTTIYAKDAEAL